MAAMASAQDFVSSQPWAVIASVLIVAGTAAYLQSPHYKLRHIPTVGSSSWPLLSYIGARRHFTHALQYYQEGYERYPGRLFKIATMGRWFVVATGRPLVRELAAIPDDEMSSFDALCEELQINHILPKEMLSHPGEVDVIKHDLTHNLAAIFPEVYDEIGHAFDEHLPQSTEWNPTPAYNLTLKVVARATNRVLIGLPFCRDAEYLQQCIAYTQGLTESTQAIVKYPSFLKPLVSPFLNKLPPTVKHVSEIISPEIDRRRNLMNEYGKDYPGKTNDFLSWMLDYWHGKPGFNSNTNMVWRLLQVNFTALHTSSATWTHALYTLAASPKWIAPLRAEIESVVEAEGLSKVALQKMVKVDAFFRESHRLNTIVGVSTRRKALKPHTFSDGSHIPAGTLIVVPTLPHHTDGANYTNPGNIDPTRFEHAKDGQTARAQFTTIDPDYLGFGYGKHACPGRFFAGNELKAMLVYLILHYDIRTEVEGVRPQDMKIRSAIMPNMQARVLFRKRQT